MFGLLNSPDEYRIELWVRLGLKLPQFIEIFAFLGCLTKDAALLGVGLIPVMSFSRRGTV